MEKLSNTELTLLTRLITGAVYDFAGKLTSLDKPLTVSAHHNAAPVADLVRDFLIERGVPECHEPYVREWNRILTSTKE